MAIKKVQRWILRRNLNQQQVNKKPIFKKDIKKIGIVAVVGNEQKFETLQDFAKQKCCHCLFMGNTSNTHQG